MASKTAVLVPSIIVALAVGALGLAFIPTDIKNRQTDFPQGIVRIGHDIIKVEIAKSNAEKQRWLMFRVEKMPLNSAMILVYEKPDLYAMWLLNIDYNLDLMWFDGAGNLVYKVKDGHRCTNTFDASDCTYKNTGPAKYVIAGASGFIDKHRITKESKLTITSI